MLAVLLWSGAAGPAGAAGGLPVPPYDPAALSEIAGNVLRRGLTGGPGQPAAEATSPRPGAAALEPGDDADGPPDPDAPAAHIEPAREGITVPIPPGSAPVEKVMPETATAGGYRSNSWRQAPPKAPRGLGFSSGVLAPSSGLDPALQTEADSLRAQGRQFVYGFLLLRVPPDKALEQQLAGLGVKLLGPHDDHHKARLPVGLLQAIATVPEVEWLGVSARAQKLSAELTELRGPRARAAGVDDATPIPIVINLFEGDATGLFRRELEAAGATLGHYDPDLQSYRAVATWPVIDRITALDFVLFVELIGRTSAGHDQSTPLLDADIIRPGTPLGHTRFSGLLTTVGVLDTGFMMGDAAAVMHQDLNKFGCGTNYTDDDAGVYDDENGHGTHVLATIAGTGTASPRYRGVATGVGSLDRIRVAKIWDHTGFGDDSWMEDGMDFMSQPSACGSVPPEVVNISGGKRGTRQTGTDSVSRKLDGKVWTLGQAYVVCGGNNGPGSQTIWSPGVAKNALTVGNVFDNGFGRVGDINDRSSRGPTGDSRMKPNLVAPGTRVTSAEAGTTNGYKDSVGCSMATPHVTGLVATLMHHYSDLKGRPALLRSHLMATALAHDDLTGMSDTYGLGRASGYLAHWTHPNSDGWSTHWFHGGVSSQGFQYGDVTVPAGTRRLVIVLTWDEPAASAGASRAVTYDLDLWVDRSADCGFTGACGEKASVSSVDNVEYIVIDDPAAATYRMKIVPLHAPTFSLRYGMTAVIIRGDPTPLLSAVLTGPSSPVVGSTFGVTVTVSTPAYVAAGVHVEAELLPSGVTLLGLQTTRHDGVTMSFPVAPDTLTLGNVVPLLSRSATWLFRADTPGPKLFGVRAWSDNGGTVTAFKALQVVALTADLAATTLGTSPPAPITAPGASLSVTDTVQNTGMAASPASTTRYYLSLDGVKSTGDRLLTGTRSIPALAPGDVDSGTVTVTVPGATPLRTYVLLACADDLGKTAEADEANNCVAAATGPVTVTRPDLVETAVSAPPATRARGTGFPITDTAHNPGAVGAAASTTRYYLSLDPVKSAGDRLLTGKRAVPVLDAGASHSGTVTVTIPASTPLSTYFLLACADNASKVAETDEKNNCKASTTTVTVTP
jgi:hypothetical protein